MEKRDAWWWLHRDEEHGIAAEAKAIVGPGVLFCCALKRGSVDAALKKGGTKKFVFQNGIVRPDRLQNRHRLHKVGCICL